MGGVQQSLNRASDLLSWTLTFSRQASFVGGNWLAFNEQQFFPSDLRPANIPVDSVIRRISLLYGTKVGDYTLRVHVNGVEVANFNLPNANPQRQLITTNISVNEGDTLGILINDGSAPDTMANVVVAVHGQEV